jgi:hypothetical protein
MSAMSMLSMVIHWVLVSSLVCFAVGLCGSIVVHACTRSYYGRYRSMVPPECVGNFFGWMFLWGAAIMMVGVAVRWLFAIAV